MDEQARLQGAVVAQQFQPGRMRSAASAVGRSFFAALRVGRLSLVYSQAWSWRYALLPIATAVALLLQSGRPLIWRSLALETLAAVCAGAGWAVARASHKARGGGYPFVGAAITLFVVAGIAAVAFLARLDVRVQALGALAALALVIDALPTSPRAHLSGAVWPVLRRLIASAGLGVGLVAVTALSQDAPAPMAFWLVGGAFSLMTFAAIQAHEVVAGDDGLAPTSPWKSGVFVALSLLGCIALAVAAALPPGAPHGMLLALFGLPAGVLATECLLTSISLPAREAAASRLDTVYTIVAMGLVFGALASAAFVIFIPAFFQALGW